MFGFSKAVFDSVINSLTGTSTSMETDSKNYTKQAQTLLNQAQGFLTQAQGFLTQAQGFLSHIPNFKLVDVTTTDSEGNKTTTQERQPDPAQDASDEASAAECQQKAEDCKAKAEDCKTNAGVLQSLAKALLAQLASLASMILGFNNANEAAQVATGNSTKLLVDGASMIRKVISVFNVPEAKNVGDWAKGFGNNVLKTFAGVDLSDGIDTDEVNKIAGIVVDTAATVVSGFTSIVVSSLVASTPIGGTGLASLAGVTARGGTNFLLNLGRDTAAKAVSKNFVSGLNFLGIKVKEPEKKEDETKVDTDGVNEALEGKQDEMEAMKDTTEKKTGESTAGTAGNTVIADGVGQVNSNNKPKFTAEELKAAQDDVERLQKEFDFAVSQRDYAQGRMDAENEKIKKAQEEYDAAVAKRDYAQKRIDAEDEKINQYETLLTYKSLTSEKRNDIENKLKLAQQRKDNDRKQHDQAIMQTINKENELDKVTQLANQRMENDRKQYSQAMNATVAKEKELDSAKAKLAEISNNV